MDSLPPYPNAGRATMEAERLNQLTNLIDDLRERLVELRGYL